MEKPNTLEIAFASITVGFNSKSDQKSMTLVRCIGLTDGFTLAMLKIIKTKTRSLFLFRKLRNIEIGKMKFNAL